MPFDFDILLFIASALLLLNLGLNFYWIIKRSQLLIIKRIIFTIILFVLPIGTLVYFYANTTPNISSSSPSTEGILKNYSEPVRVVFNLPVDSTRLTENVTPSIKGYWEWLPYFGISKLTRVGLFYPQETLFEDQRVVIYLTGIGRVGFPQEGHEGGFVFDSAKLPEILSIDPENKSTNIEDTQDLTIKYDKPLEQLAEISYTFNPATEFDIIEVDKTTYKIKPKTSWQLSTHYTLTVDRTDKRYDLETNTELEHDNPVTIHQYDFSTKNEPLINHFSPIGKDAKVNSEIKMLFFNEMDKDSVEKNFLISPEINGTFNWVTNKALVYKPLQPLPRGTQFRVLLSNGIKDASGMSAGKDLVYDFETIGKINIVDYSPRNNEVRVDQKSIIKIQFNQEVDHSSVESRFSTNPSIQGNFVWGEDNSMAFIPTNNLQFDTKYSVVIQSGITSLYGIDSTDVFNFSFTTKRNEVVISMPLYYQPQYPVSFSCNIYASMMALAWKGYSTNVSGLISEIGNNPAQDGAGRWTGNPNNNFIGNADGSWGYGAYWYAMQKVFNNRGIQTEVHENWNLSALAKSIEAGHPVQIWRYNGTSADRNLEWGSAGVYAINGQHGGVVTGFRGSSDNPTAIYINDPWFGLVWMDSGTFDYYWSRLNRVGLVIF